ncbi:MAG TPA: hypothetical protein VGT03_08020 [Candidatus Acidoferrales bacterium]|nr:hypothetical protein [Candidatus Acidoferrales bacterium]
MRRNVLILGLSLAFATVGARAQDQPPSPAGMAGITQGDVYCSGIVTTQAVPSGTQVVSGEQSDSKLTFAKGDYIYINKGSSKGVKPGDEFSVVRRVNDDTGIPWFAAQDRLLHGMGQAWADVGRIKVLIAAKNISTAQVVDSCDFMIRGDVVVPFAERPMPDIKSEKDFDRFAPPSGKPKAMVVTGKSYRIQSGNDDIVYVNLGSAQGVKVGDYFRVFRYQGNRNETVFQTPNVATEVYGYGSAPGHYKGSDLPREILGEGVVLRTSSHSSTVLITYSLREIFEGDYCELE